MSYNEIIQWLALAYLLWRLDKHERCLEAVLGFFAQLPKLLKLKAEELDDDSKQN